MINGKHLTLGIETSCDETAVSVVADGREVLSNIISTQISIHTQFGGVVPEIASRRHLENINDVLERALDEAGVSIGDIDLVGVTYGKITFRIYKSKWGSCKADGSLAFNILLMLTPDEIIDSVIVHELCHRLEMNHSGRFYRQVYRVCPDYDERYRWLKNHRDEIMAQAGLL